MTGGHAGADEQERLGAVVLLFGAGFDSPASMVGMGTKVLLKHPGQARLVAEEPAPAGRAVAEILRYEPPVQLVVRAALEPTRLSGTDIGAGLASLQGEVLFPRLLRRFPGLRQAGPPVYRAPGSTLRGLDHLPLLLHA